MSNQVFSQRLNEAMAMRKIKGSQLAKIVGTSPVNITCYRKGKYAPKLYMIKRIADALSVNPSWLAGIINDPDPVEMSEKDAVHNQIEYYIADMTADQVKKVLAFIEQFIIK